MPKTSDRYRQENFGTIGVILSSGVQVKFPLHIGYQLTNMARRGARIEAQGFGSRNSYGQVIETTSLSYAKRW